jgi:hypothetical protein
MKKSVSVLLLCFTAFLLCSNTSLHGPTPVVGGPYLGFNLMPGPNSSMVNFAIVRIYPDGHKEADFITRNEFIRMASGCHGDANPDGINFFSKYEIEDCGIVRDSIFKRTYFVCSPLEQLWKLRYKQGPYAGPDSLGWTHATVPSASQMNILKSYGANSLDDYICGEQAFKLLHDMQSYAWQSRYKSM